MQKAHKAIWERDYIKSILLARDSFKMKKTLPPIQEDDSELMPDEQSEEQSFGVSLSQQLQKLAVMDEPDVMPMSGVESPLNTMDTSQCQEWSSSVQGNGKRICTENGVWGAYGGGTDIDYSPTSSSDDQQSDSELVPVRRRRHRSSNSI
ncbi:hypothetical protein AWZ03_009896 [Drosophila navojoa]|uniref:Uncharacterized protein n=1 Tax=Drosophila navojoa TaxID=7232 RepID=A0A484B4I2_DRONA|nr:hypothetical protein AWZ03_009896 [Drosophila navojoa]